MHFKEVDEIVNIRCGAKVIVLTMGSQTIKNKVKVDLVMNWSTNRVTVKGNQMIN